MRHEPWLSNEIKKGQVPTKQCKQCQRNSGNRTKRKLATRRKPTEHRHNAISNLNPMWTGRKSIRSIHEIPCHCKKHRCHNSGQNDHLGTTLWPFPSVLSVCPPLRSFPSVLSISTLQNDTPQSSKFACTDFFDVPDSSLMPQP